MQAVGIPGADGPQTAEQRRKASSHELQGSVERVKLSRQARLGSRGAITLIPACARRNQLGRQIELRRPDSPRSALIVREASSSWPVMMKTKSTRSRYREDGAPR